MLIMKENHIFNARKFFSSHIFQHKYADFYYRSYQLK